MLLLAVAGGSAAGGQQGGMASLGVWLEQAQGTALHNVIQGGPAALAAASRAVESGWQAKGSHQANLLGNAGAAAHLREWAGATSLDENQPAATCRAPQQFAAIPLRRRPSCDLHLELGDIIADYDDLLGRGAWGDVCRGWYEVRVNVYCL
jgi:hypothetical protein